MIFDPPVFRIIVVEENHKHTNTLTFKEETIKLYYAQALEWDLGGQGKTVEEALASVERLIFGQQCIYDSEPDTYRLGPAPEEWQRVRNISKEVIHVRKDYVKFLGTARHTIVCRKDIDMRKTQLKAVDNE